MGIRTCFSRGAATLNWSIAASCIRGHPGVATLDWLTILPFRNGCAVVVQSAIAVDAGGQSEAEYGHSTSEF